LQRDGQTTDPIEVLYQRRQKWRAEVERDHPPVWVLGSFAQYRQRHDDFLAALRRHAPSFVILQAPESGAVEQLREDVVEILGLFRTAFPAAHAPVVVSLSEVVMSVRDRCRAALVRPGINCVDHTAERFCELLKAERVGPPRRG